MTTIRVNLEALAQDAQAWSCVSGGLGDLAGLMSRVHVTHRDFMAFLAPSSDAAAATTAALRSLEDFAKGGAERTAQGALVLREVRDAYLANEDAARADLDGLWEPDDD